MATNDDAQPLDPAAPAPVDPAPAAEPASAPATDAPVAEGDAFAAAFAEAAREEAAPAEAKGAPGVIVTDGAVEKPAAPAAPAVPAPAVPAPAPAVPAPEAQTPAPVAPPTATDLARELAAAMREAQQPAPAPQAPVQQSLPTFSYTQDQVKDIREFEESFPEVARAVQARMDHLAFNMASQMLMTVAQRYEPVLAQVQALAESSQISELRTRNPDYDTINKDAVLDWIEQQPTYLKAAYAHVVQAGTAAEVTDLLGRYKQSLSAAAPAPAAPAAPAAPGQAPRPAAPAPRPAPSPAAQAAARGMAPVRTARTAPPQPGVAADDFEGAFKAFAKDAGSM